MKITYLLILAMVLLFAASYAGDTGAVFDRFGFSGTSLFLHPETLVTSIFLHGSIEHLLSNIIVMLFVGLAVEKELGGAKMMAVFFAGAFAGDLVSLLFYPMDTISIGASGGIFALLGVGMLVRPLDLSAYPLVIPVPLAFLGVMYIAYNAYGFFTDTSSNISYIAHFGGLAVGLAYGVFLRGIKKSLQIILIAAAAMLFIAGMVFFITRSAS